MTFEEQQEEMLLYFIKKGVIPQKADDDIRYDICDNLCDECPFCDNVCCEGYESLVTKGRILAFIEKYPEYKNLL